MANEQIQTSITAVEAPIAAPVVESPTVAPVVAPTEVPIQTDTPIPETTETPVTEAPKAPETVLGEALTNESTSEVTTQDGESNKEATTSEEGETSSEVAPDEGGQSDDPAPPPKYDPFTLPEDIKLDESRIVEFTNLLSELETSGKASHEAVQAFGQKAVEFHINEVKNAVENLTSLYQTAWDKQKTDWKDSFLKDPEIGGNRFQTTVDSALAFIKTHGGTPEQQEEFRGLMETSGLGNHPAMIRMLANAGRAMQEGKPLAAPKPVPQQKSKTQTLYGKV